MPTEEIPVQDWMGFLDMFSRQHEGWDATLEVLGGDDGAGLAAREMPLAGTTADVKPWQRAIAITLCERDSEHLTHIVSDPKSVRLTHTRQGAHEALAIDSANGLTTLLCFRSPMPTKRPDDMRPDSRGGKTAAGRPRSLRDTVT